jgi:hypothetical protein
VFKPFIGLTDLPCSSTYLKSILSFLEARVLTDIALAAKSKVEYDSSKWIKLGDTQAQIVVLQLPPSDSVSNRVNFESRKGTKLSGLLEARAETQLDRAAIDLLIFLASCSLSPSDPVLLSRSDPARSTIVKRAFRYIFFYLLGALLSFHFCSKNIYSTACDLLDVLFIPVWLTALRLIPIATYYSNYSLVLTLTCVNPSTKIPVLGSSRICRFGFVKELVDKETPVFVYLIGDSDFNEVWDAPLGSRRSVIYSMYISKNEIVTRSWASFYFCFT